MFSRDDIYTSSGAVKLWGCWTGNVTKYDTSSFYNWETDNEPLYDLEERTYHNWEKLGYPASTVPGVALTVSADAPAASATCGTNIYTSVSAAIAALPRVINFPIVIEIGNFGDLEYLDLEDIVMGNRGSLEIINQNFAKVYNPSATIKTVATPYNLAASIESLDLSNTLYGDYSISCLDASTAVLSSAGDIRATETTVIAELAEPATYSNQLDHRNNRLSVSIKNDIRSGVANRFNIPSFEAASPGTGGETDNSDCSTINTLSTGLEAYRDWSPVNGSATCLVYGNYLSGVRVKNCTGPLYIRNFLVDGARASEVGFAVDNCTDLVLENCASIRNIKNGFEINNSDITVTRGIVGYRNYNVTGSNRVYGINGEWSSVSAYDSDTVVESFPGNGLEANNSKITFSSTLSIEASNYLKSGSLLPPSATDFLANFSRNLRGIVLNNSILTGGISRGLLTVAGASRLVTELNVDKGVHADNSKINLDGILDVHGNSRGAVFKNSVVELDHLLVQNNQHRGVHCINSTLKYNKNVYQQNPLEAYQFSANGQHLIVEGGSLMEPVYTSGMDSNGNAMEYRYTFGLHTDDSRAGRSLLPAISVKDNSKATFLHTYINREWVGSKTAGTDVDTTLYGGGIEVLNNSKAKFQGTRTRCTAIEGPSGIEDQKNRAGVYVKDNSEVEFNGPTIIAQWAVDALAEDGSVINFNPPKDGMGYDVSTFNLDDYRNHTGVELHSTRACLVANRNSKINMRDLGNFQTCWSGTNGTAALNKLPDYVPSGQGNDVATSSGFMQFYPNANDAAAYASPYSFNANANLTRSFVNATVDAQSYIYNLKNYRAFNDSANQASSITTGGVCVRAVGNSTVTARNVNFPCGFHNPSGLYYDLSARAVGGTGGKTTGPMSHFLHIWNIADNSQLDAAYLSVSGMHPEDVNYHGPSAVYASSTAGSGAQTAPFGTPDTSSLAVLDYYGIGTGFPEWPIPGQFPGEKYGQTSAKNKGPFRLYVGVDGLANHFIDSSGHTSGDDASGHINQIFSQGYNFSGTLKLWDNTTSALYGKPLRFAADKLLVTSGFYYCSSLVSPDTYKRITIDESAANTFANAKNGAMGSSGRPQICSIHRLNTNAAGESAAATYRKRGKGFKSPNVFDLDRDN